MNSWRRTTLLPMIKSFVWRGAASAVLAVLLIGALAAPPARAQSLPTLERGWFSAGLGRGLTGDGRAGLATDLSLNAQAGPHVLTLRIASVIHSISSGSDDLALLYGRAASTKRAHVSAAAGLARTEAVSGNSAVPGFAAQVQAYAAPFGRVGVGVTAFGNLNARESFGGVAVGLRLGRLRGG